MAVHHIHPSRPQDSEMIRDDTLTHFSYPTNIFPEVGIVYIIYSLCLKHDMTCKSVALGIIKNQSYQPFYTNFIFIFKNWSALSI